MFAFIKRMILLSLLVGVFALPAVSANAATTTDETTEDSTIEQLQQQVQSLVQQVSQLKEQLQEAKKETEEAVEKTQETKEETRSALEDLREEIQLNRSLSRGKRGEDVEGLQKFLAQFPDIYPEGLTTGYFGSLTQRAVERFQEKTGIESVGIVGPKTRSRIRSIFENGAGNSGNIPPGLQKNFGGDEEKDMDDEVDNSTSISTEDVADEEGEDEETDSTESGSVYYKNGKVIVCHKDTDTLRISTSALGAHMNHGDQLGSCSGDSISETDAEEIEEEEDESEAEEDIEEENKEESAEEGEETEDDMSTSTDDGIEDETSTTTDDGVEDETSTTTQE